MDEPASARMTARTIARAKSIPADKIWRMTCTSACRSLEGTFRLPRVSSGNHLHAVAVSWPASARPGRYRESGAGRRPTPRSSAAARGRGAPASTRPRWRSISSAVARPLAIRRSRTSAIGHDAATQRDRRDPPGPPPTGRRVPASARRSPHRRRGPASRTGPRSATGSASTSNLTAAHNPDISAVRPWNTGSRRALGDRQLPSETGTRIGLAMPIVPIY
jgi:hypothetical protein